MTNCSHRKYLGRVDNWDLMPLASVLAFLFTYPSRDGGGWLPHRPCPSATNPGPHCHRTNADTLERETAPKLNNEGGHCIWSPVS